MLILVFMTALCIIVVKAAFSSADLIEDTWTPKAPMQQARGGVGVAAVNGKIYAIGGSTASGQYPSDLYADGFVGTNEEYDPEKDTWTAKAPMPTPRDDFAIAAYQNKIYCIGGAVGFSVNEWGSHSIIPSGVNEVYDTDTNTWETKTPMPDVEIKLKANVVNGKIYVMGVAFTYVYDPNSDSWTRKTRLPASPMASLMSVVIDDKIFVTFEFTTFNSSTGFESYEQKVMTYDTKTDTWSAGTSGPTAIIQGAAGATIGAKAPERVYVLGLSYGKFPPPSTNQVYDPKAEIWTTATEMPTLRIDFGVVVIDDVLYAIGGYTYTSRIHGTVTPTAVNEQYTPIGYGIRPEIKILSPANQSYNESSMSLVFTVDKPVNWTGCSLDGSDNVTITGNTTLTDLSNGIHTVTVYVNDTFGNMGNSETVSFNVAAPEAFPTVPVAVASGASAIAITAGLLVYLRKRRHEFKQEKPT
jgi:N-acetylneuraminic acid mutarotase